MRTLFIAVAVLAIMPAATACDVCGCSAGGNYFGILPGFHRHFIGLRWTTESSYTALSSNALQEGRYHSVERFTTVDAVARFYPARRWQTLLLTPYHWYSQTEDGVPSQVQGLGDVSLLVNYLLFDTGDSVRYRWRQTLNMGGGVKLPTGRHNFRAADGAALNPNLQPGTGSTDFLISAAYTLRRGGWGIAADLLARLNTRNRQDYQFGNRLSGGARFFYWTNIRSIALLPSAGVFAEAAGANRDGARHLNGSEGLNTFATVGLDAYATHFSVGTTIQPVIWQSRATVRANARWMISLNYIF